MKIFNNSKTMNLFNFVCLKKCKSNCYTKNIQWHALVHCFNKKKNQLKMNKNIAFAHIET